jgi:hypothetical protein
VIKRYICQGVIRCSNDCGQISRPKIDPRAQSQQLSDPCAGCQADLTHDLCGSVSWLLVYGQKGDDLTTRKYLYINGPLHNHARFAHVPRTVALEEKKWKKSSRYHTLNTTPSQAMVGKETANGYIGAAPDCGQKFQSQAYVGHRLHKDKEKSGKGKNTGFGHFKWLRNWKSQHATVLCRDYTGEGVTVISVQTSWMREQAIPRQAVASENNPVAGLLSDAAHKFFADSSAHLIVTSTFSPLIQKWVPVLFSYADGATATHYKLHFTTLIEGIALLASERELPVTDDLFLMVCLSKNVSQTII